METLNVNSVGPRYPTVGFHTFGYGLTNKGYDPQPYETFAYDEALLMAKIQDFNVVPYTSVLPKDVKILDEPEEVGAPFFHGAVLEVIMAGIGATYSKGPGQRNVGIRRHGRNYVLDSDGPVMAIAACIGQLTEVADRNGTVIGGYVAEYVGIFDAYIGQEGAQKQAHTQLTESLDNILTIREYDKESGNRRLYDVTYAELSESNTHGYALNALGFLGFADAPPPPNK